MRVGLSLPLVYLAEGPTRSAAATVWRDAFGSADACLHEMRGSGVTSIELRSVPEDADPDLTLRAARRIWNAGLDLTVHGRLPRPVRGETVTEVYPSLAPLSKALRDRGVESMLTVHCYSADRGDADALAERTVDALRAIAAIIQKEDVPLRIALEINHVGARADPGTTYGGILDMIARVSSPRIGACWDLGHAYMNVQHGALERSPDAAFLERVIHTHVHDLGPRTHSPLTCGVVPLDLYLDLLDSHGYPGVLNLELSPERYRGQVAELVDASVERLVEYCRRRG
jgi:sugar phosphate isomerase/epimerase